MYKSRVLSTKLPAVIRVVIYDVNAKTCDCLILKIPDIGYLYHPVSVATLRMFYTDPADLFCTLVYLQVYSIYTVNIEMFALYIFSRYSCFFIFLNIHKNIYTLTK